MKYLIISILFAGLTLASYAKTIKLPDLKTKREQVNNDDPRSDKNSTLYFGEPEVIASGQGWVTILCNPPYTYICVWIHDERDNNYKTIIVNDGNFTEYKVLSDLKIEHNINGTKITFKSK